jgi:hypothetical protein
MSRNSSYKSLKHRSLRLLDSFVIRGFVVLLRKGIPQNHAYKPAA